ncbi:MAG: GTP-binding protein [Candidatus Woesearchaeota archaeon]
MDPIPVTVLSGFLGSGKTTLLNRILTENHGLRIAVIVNDMSEVNIDAEKVKHSITHADESLVQMTNGCICCTLREDLLIAVRDLARQKKFDYIVIESSGISEPLPVAETFTFEDEEGNSLSRYAVLDTMVTMIDAHSFPTMLDSNSMLENLGGQEGDDRTLATLLVEQVEFADVIIINKTDLCDEQTLQNIRTIITSLNPQARRIETSHANVPIDEVIATHRFSLEKAEAMPMWLKEARGEHVPETEEYGIVSTTFTANKPFHPGRIHEWIGRNTKDIIRAKGSLWIATKPDLILEFSKAGSQREVRPIGVWDAADPNYTPEDTQWGDRESVLIFIGQHLDTEAIHTGLEACLITDEEASHMDTLEDPFPDWGVASDS